MKALLALSVLIIMAACHNKAVPVITERKAEPPKRIATIYAPPGTVTPDAAAGKTIYEANCNRCHGLPDVSLYRSGRWEGILQTMIPRTRLNEEQAVHVREYVLAHAAK
jgi:mono/diheme cytochrome c family protein